MSRQPRGRRAVVLLGLSLACGGIAASHVREREQELDERVGRMVPVVVAREELPPNTKLGERRAARALAVEQVPARFVPPDALAAPLEAVGLRTAAAIAPGGYVTAGALETGDHAEQAGPLLSRGERAVEVDVAGGEALAEDAGPGARVDVLVTTDRRSGAGRTFVALENVELLGIRAGSDAPTEAGAPMTATLRVGVRAAVYLAAAANFAREVRLLARSPNDRRRAGANGVDAAGL